MHGFETTGLWTRTLGQQSRGDKHAPSRTRLREAFFRFRERAATLAGEIGGELPNRTVHDVTHLDALWGIADLIAGPAFPLTPTEAFVLGGAFLVHDLAMSRAAYAGSFDAIREKPVWLDAVAAHLRTRLGRIPRDEEMQNPPPEVAERALEEVLITLHAEQAESLLIAKWPSENPPEDYYLIEDQELRQTYGRLVGRIAHSHWWTIDRVGHEFKALMGAPGWCPTDWTVNSLKLACLLRVADACHLDERRAPGFLRTLRKPAGISDEHWLFQMKLVQPQLHGDRLAYTAKSPFTLAEAPAWWCCYDALRVADRELHSVDCLLYDSGLDSCRLAARGVDRIESSERLAERIPTEGWLPVNAQVRATDVAALAQSIGGRHLYGENLTVPLRELIQNATDAVRARRVLEGRPEDWGDVTVRVGEEEGEPWVEVEDNGLGMSRHVLTGPLLDFGVSYWRSQLVREEYPGLLSKRFRPTGQFGIGFFSVFMWGSHVRVTTRRYDAAHLDTLVLEFGGGLSTRPILRKAGKAEAPPDGGTRVRVWMSKSEKANNNLFYSALHQEEQLLKLCLRHFPALDANLFVETAREKPKKVLTSFDWLRTPGRLLLRSQDSDRIEDLAPDFLSAIDNNLRLMITATGEIVGRACIIPNLADMRLREKALNELHGLVTCNGICIVKLTECFGVLTGSTSSVKRNQAVLDADDEGLATWATEQAQLAMEVFKEPLLLTSIARTVRCCGGDILELPIAMCSEGWMSIKETVDWVAKRDEVLLVSRETSEYCVLKYKIKHELSLGNNVLFVPAPPFPGYGSLSAHQRHMRRDHYYYWDNARIDYLTEVVCGAMATAWSASVEDVLRQMAVDTRFAGENVMTFKVHKTGSWLPAPITAIVIRRPNRQ